MLPESWKIDYKLLPGPYVHWHYLKHMIFPSLDGSRAVVLYAIVDRIKAGSFAIYEDRLNPRLIFTPNGAPFTVSLSNNSVIWLAPKFLAIKKFVALGPWSAVHTPYILLDLDREVHSFIRCDDHQGLNYASGVVEVHEQKGGESQVSERHQVAELEWRGLDELGFGQFNKWYKDSVMPNLKSIHFSNN